MVDPLSITVGVSSLLVVTARVIKATHDICSARRDAAFMLSAIISECTVISASLARLQDLMLSNSDALNGRLTPQIASTFDIALQGCALTLSVLDEELGGFFKESGDRASGPKKFKYVLEKDHLQELLQQIRGQQIAVTLLLQTYQSESLAEIKQSIQEYNAILQQISRRGRSLWQASHHEGGSQEPPDAIYGSGDSIFETSSLVSSTQFDFDDEIIDSKAYRRALANVRQATGAEQDAGELYRMPRELSPKENDAVQRNRSPKRYGLDYNADSPVHPQIIPEVLVTPSFSHYSTSVVAGKNPNTNAMGTTSSTQATTSPGWGPNNRFDLAVAFEDGITLESESLETSDSNTIVPDRNRAAVVRQRDVDPNLTPSVTFDREISDPFLDMLHTTETQHGSGSASRPRTPTASRGKLIILGDSCCGKTALCLKFCQGSYPDFIPQTVFETYAADVDVGGSAVELMIHDTAGSESYDQLRPVSYPDTHVGLICFNIGKDCMLDNIAEKWISEWLHFCERVPFILVGCFKDLRYYDDNQQRAKMERDSDYLQDLITEAQGRDAARRFGAFKYMECSAKTGEGVNELFEQAARLALLNKAEIERMKKSAYGRLSRLFRNDRKRS